MTSTEPSLTGHPAGDAILPAALDLVRAVRDEQPAAVQAAISRAFKAADGWEPVTALVCTVAALVPDLDVVPPAELLSWCTNLTLPSPAPSPPPAARLSAEDRRRAKNARMQPQPLPDHAAVIVTAAGTSVHAVHPTTVTALGDLLVDLDDTLDALPPSLHVTALRAHRDAIWELWRSATTPVANGRPLRLVGVA